MSNDTITSRWKCLFFGMPCAFSAPILSALSRPDIELVGIVSPQSTPDPEPFRLIRGLRSRATVTLSGQAAHFTAPRYLVRDIGHPRLHSELAALQPDLIIVACFPRLLPAEIVTTARIAAINVHPSLLPRHRGPDPLYWTFHARDDQSGATLHLLTDQYDAGDILTQATTSIGTDESLPALERRLAKLGAELIARLIDELPHLPGPTPQDASSASWEPWPRAADRVIDRGWTRERARRFIAGVASSHGPLTYRDDTQLLSIRGLTDPGMGHEIRLQDGTLFVA
jgi:methionyl-tRNA formyltransferase